MKRQWKKICVKATFWLLTEIILNLFGLDNLADYSEFIFEQEIALSKHQPQIAIVVPFRRPRVDRNMPYRFTMALNA
jgi:hypothetical protein